MEAYSAEIVGLLIFAGIVYFAYRRVTGNSPDGGGQGGSRPSPGGSPKDPRKDLDV